MENIEEQWKIVQTKTFTKWVNSKLVKAGYNSIENLFKDVCNGIPIVNLLHALGKGPVNHNPTPASRIHKMENMSYVLEYIKSDGIILINIGPSDIVDGDHKLILGLIWTIISKMSMGSSKGAECSNMREELLEWVQRVTETYDNVNVKNFTTSWSDGLAFNAIIHKFRPNLIENYHDLKKTEPELNMNKAFTVAEKHLDIPRLFDPEDITHSITPDEKSIMTYVSQFYTKFKPEERDILNKNRIGNFLRGFEWSISAKNQYELRARKFIEDKTNLSKRVSDIKEQIFKICESLNEIDTINSELISESCELSLLLSNINDADDLFNLKKYTPPVELSGDEVNIDYLKVSSLLNISKLYEAVSLFENQEAISIENSKNEVCSFLAISDKITQMNKLPAIETKLTSLELTSDSKKSVITSINSLISDKKSRLNKFMNIHNNTSSLIATAQKLFKISDVKRTGQITLADFKKILKAVKIDSESLNFSSSDLISMDQVSDTITKLSSPVANPLQLKTAFSELNNGMPVDIHEIVPNVVFKNIIAINNGNISFNDIENELNCD